MVLGFRGSTNIGIYNVFGFESFKKTRKHNLFDNFRPLRDWEKKRRANNNNNKKKKKKQKKKKKKKKHKNKHKNKDAFARISKGTQALLHTKPFTQRSLLHRTAFTQSNFYTENFGTEKKTQTAQRSFCTSKILHAETLYPEQLLHTETFPHRRLYAQKSLCTAVFTQTFLFTDAFTYTDKLLQTEICAHSRLLHTASFYTKRLCFPFLITYLSCSPSQVSLNPPVSPQYLGYIPLSSLFTVRNLGWDPSGLDPIPFKSQKKTKNPRSSYLIVVSPRGSNETKETVGMNGVSYQGNDDFAG